MNIEKGGSLGQITQDIMRHLGEEDSKAFLDIMNTYEPLGNDGFIEDPEDLMRGFDHERRRNVLEMESEFESTYVDDSFLKYLQWVYWGGEDKKVLGRTMSELVIPISDGNGGEKPRINIPERMIHETMHDQISKAASLDLKRSVMELGIGGRNPGLVELNTGMGSFTYRLQDAGFEVLATVEGNEDLLSCTQEIWKELKINGISFINDDAWKFVENNIENDMYQGKKITVITADPPWGKYVSNGSEYDFSMFDPDGRHIIKHLIKYAPVVALKLPGAFNINEIRSLANELKTGLRYFEYTLCIGDRRVGENMAVFIRQEESSGMKYQHIFRELD